MISASFWDDKIAWYENTNGLGNFGPQQIITTNANGVIGMYVTDIDGDLDMDVLSASRFDDKIAWYENDGYGNFVEHIITTDSDDELLVYVADINGDGYIDVLSASQFDIKIVW